MLTAPQADGTTFTASTLPPPSDLRSPSDDLRSPVGADIAAPHNRWRVEIAPRAGWVPAWHAPMLAVVVVVSSLIGLLVCAILVSRRRLIWVISELKVCINVCLCVHVRVCTSRGREQAV